MKFLQYVNYFFYIAFNWNLRLALFTIRHEIRGEKKYGIDTSKLNNLQGFSIKGNNFKHAELYQGSNYFLLEKLFAYLQTVDANTSIIDFGCGKGRVLAVAAFYGFNKIMGVEFARELCNIARQNIVPLQVKFPHAVFEVIHENAADYTIDNDANVFFFFNPFDEVVMLAVVKNILRSLKLNPRQVYAVYINPLYKEIFMSAGFTEVYHLQKMYYVNASIFMYDVQC